MNLSLGVWIQQRIYLTQRATLRMDASGDNLAEKLSTDAKAIDHSIIVVIPVWVLNDMILHEMESENMYRSIGHRRDANEHRGRREMLQLIMSDEAWLEQGCALLADLAAARVKPPCHHVWIDVTLKEDADQGMKRKLCQVCSDVVTEAVANG